jgi:hypothetical protein
VTPRKKGEHTREDPLDGRNRPIAEQNGDSPVMDGSDGIALLLAKRGQKGEKVTQPLPFIGGGVEVVGTWHREA